jgi:hypothetical protein
VLCCVLCGSIMLCIMWVYYAVYYVGLLCCVLCWSIMLCIMSVYYAVYYVGLLCCVLCGSIFDKPLITTDVSGYPNFVL